MRSRGACWEWTIPADTEITGPMALRLWVQAHGAGDIDLFAGVEKWRGKTYIGFEGSYGFGCDPHLHRLAESLTALPRRAGLPAVRPGPRLHPAPAARARPGRPG